MMKSMREGGASMDARGCRARAAEGEAHVGGAMMLICFWLF